MWNKDELAGKAEQAKGVVKEKVGHALGDETLEADGATDQAEGKIRETVGTATRVVQETADELKKRLAR